jgi:hypothetical protein
MSVECFVMMFLRINPIIYVLKNNQQHVMKSVDADDGPKLGGRKFGMQHGPHHQHSWG